ncbi:MAG: DUF3524 domain-containing protein [Phycisphaerae bacterium]
MAGDEDQGRLRILALEPYYGGSHRVFLDTLVRHSRHRFVVLSLPARKWKWRMRGSAIWFAERLAEKPVDGVDLIFANDMVSVADLRALLPERLKACPVVCYFHENQLTYPLSENDVRDYQYGFTNVTSCLASDEVWFNSQSHLDAFLPAVEALLGSMPDFRPVNVIDRIRSRSRVAWPLVEGPPPSVPGFSGGGWKRTESPVILWSHRWEYDKNPELFFRTLCELDSEGLAFSLVLLGESFREVPAVFRSAWSRLERRIVHRGFVDSRDHYWRILADCNIVVSTAIQENFGLSTVEAMLAGCFPLLPNSLSYAELVPLEYHALCLYDSDEMFGERLRDCLGHCPPAADLASVVRTRFCLADGISMYDKHLERVGRMAP